MAAPKKAAAKKGTAVKATGGPKKKKDETLDERPELSPEAALDVIEADYEEDQKAKDGAPIWPENVAIQLGEDDDGEPVVYEYRTSDADDVLAIVQITLTLDSKNEERIRSIIKAILHPDDHALFVDDVREYLDAERRAGNKINANEFFEQITTGIISTFTEFMTPKGPQRSGGRSRTGRRSRSRR